MKRKTLYMFWVLTLIFTMHSCDSNFLEEQPTTFVSPSNFYNSQEEAQLVLNGAYDALQSQGLYQQYGFGYFWGDMGVDLGALPSWGTGDGDVTLGTYTMLPTQQQVELIWQNLYAAIQRTNIVINQIEKMDVSLFEDVEFGDETINMKDVMLGEAHFLRGLHYFYGVMVFGNIPLVLEETTSFGSDSYVEQNTPEETYAQIIDELTKAEESLPWVRLDGEGGKATKGAAKSLLGNVYLQMTGFPLYDTDKFSLAAAKLKEVIEKAENDGIYRLLDDYADVFDYQNDNNDEIIFSVQYLEGSEGGWTGTLQGMIGTISKGGGYETTYVNHDFIASFDSSDVRLAHNVTNISATTGKPVTNGQYGPWKYHKPNPNNWGIQTPIDWPVLRYSEILLKYAEALNGLNSSPTQDAYNAINKVRERARPADHKTDGTVLPDLTNLTKAEFLEALLQEDAWELCWEGKRKATLIRTGKLKEYITEPKYNIQNIFGFQYYPGQYFDEDKHYWYPIPQREMDINPNLVQNPGF